jgi:hypothetical protein
MKPHIESFEEAMHFVTQLEQAWHWRTLRWSWYRWHIVSRRNGQEIKRWREWIR